MCVCVSSKAQLFTVLQLQNHHKIHVATSVIYISQWFAKSSTEMKML